MSVAFLSGAHFFSLLSLFVILFPLHAFSCPDWRASPHFGQISLNAGFTPDPFVRNITAGGSIALRNCFNTSYRGFVTTRPDFDLYWNGRSSRLTIAVESAIDTILLINDPSGRWWYDDDTYGVNPVVVFNNPQPGLYNIWIGSYDGSRFNPGRLMITEYRW